MRKNQVSNSIIKVCRIHNEIDLKTVQQMGVNYLGIHAVISDKEEYYKKWQHLQNSPVGDHYKELPVSEYEITGIRKMISMFPKEIVPVLVLENPLEIESILACAKCYGMNIETSGLQFQCRVNRKYLECVKKIGFAHIWITVGVCQKDASGYCSYLNECLDPERDVILIDMSKHQPDIIKGKEVYRESVKMSKLKAIAKPLSTSKVPIVIADDTVPEMMKTYIGFLECEGVKVIGYDMQNAVETDKPVVKLIEETNKGKYWVIVRKDLKKVEKWNDFNEWLIGKV